MAETSIILTSVELMGIVRCMVTDKGLKVSEI